MTVTVAGRGGTGSRVRVTVTYRAATDVPLIGGFLGDRTIRSSTTMRVEGPTPDGRVSDEARGSPIAGCIEDRGEEAEGGALVEVVVAVAALRALDARRAARRRRDRPRCSRGWRAGGDRRLRSRARRPRRRRAWRRRSRWWAARCRRGTPWTHRRRPSGRRWRTGAASRWRRARWRATHREARRGRCPSRATTCASTTYHTARVTSVERGRSSGALSITAPVTVSLRW